MFYADDIKNAAELQHLFAWHLVEKKKPERLIHSLSFSLCRQ